MGSERVRALVGKIDRTTGLMCCPSAAATTSASADCWRTHLVEEGLGANGKVDGRQKIASKGSDGQSQELGVAHQTLLVLLQRTRDGIACARTATMTMEGLEVA